MGVLTCLPVGEGQVKMSQPDGIGEGAEKPRVEDPK